MRNLKRVLSLALASIMLLGMMVVGAGAASKDFTDSDEIKNVEAVDVMVALGVLEGGNKGDFQPNSILTREQAAKIICYLLLGSSSAEKLTTNYSIFSDVPASRWSAPFISYCVNLGILAGDGHGNFYPEGKLTGVAFAKMLLVALGYNAEREDYVGNDWMINVSADAIGARIAPKGLVLSEELSRQDAAQMAFNTLKATMVEYQNDTTIIVGGTTVSTASKATPVPQGVYANTMGAENLQFAEKNFSSLKKVSDTDKFGRPAYTWTYNKTDIGTYVDTALLAASYTTAVKGGEVYSTIGSVASKFDLTYYQDGVAMSTTNAKAQAAQLKKGNTDTMGASGNGVLTEVYVDVDNETLTIVEINTYLAKATADYNAKKETLSVEVYGDTVGKIYLEDVASIADVKEGTYMLVNVADGVIVNVMEPTEVKDSAITKYSVASAKPKYVVVDGEQYDSAATLNLFPTGENGLDAYNKEALENFTYNVYVDQYGYGIGIERVTGTAKYLFLVGYDKPTSNLTTSTAKAAAIFTDGTMKEIQVAFKDSNDELTTDLSVKGESDRNQWVKYTEDDGVYTLSDATNTVNVAAAAGKKSINCENVRIVDKTNNKKVAYGNDDSIYITVKAEADVTDIDGDAENGDAITKVTNTYTGVQNVDLKLNTTATGTIADSIFAVYDADSKYIIAAVVLGEDDSSSTGYAYAVKGAESESFSDGYYYWDFQAVVDGAIEKLTVKSKYTSTIDEIKDVVGAANVGDPALMKLTYDAEGKYVTGIELLDDDAADDNVYSNADMGASEDIDPSVFNAFQVTFGRGKVLTASGRTLYTNAGGDVGLTITTGAPVVVLQKDAKGNLSVEDYTTIAAALDALEDSDAFVGTIAAKLNEKGTAEWLVLSSSVQLTEDNKVETTKGMLEDVILWKNGTSLAVTVETTAPLSTTDSKAVNVVVEEYMKATDTWVAVYTGTVTIAANAESGAVTAVSAPAANTIYRATATYGDGTVTCSNFTW